MTNISSLRLVLAFLALLAAPTFGQGSIVTLVRTSIRTQSQGPPPTLLPSAPFIGVELPMPQNALYGMSFADLDRDGDADLYNNNTGRSWENSETSFGREWVHSFLHDLDRPAATVPVIYHYAAALADFNNDGLPDLATAPHTGSDPLQIFFNSSGDMLGGVLWSEMTFPKLPVRGEDLQRSFETHCWGDIDGDGALDLFAPAYSDGSQPLTGNLFLRGRQGAVWRFEDQSTQGFGNPSQCDCFPGLVKCSVNVCRDCRPEGAQMFDLDDDGDLDIYCNGTTYLNVSRPGEALAVELDDSTTGIGYIQELDEGAVFSDVDMDGDFDLVLNYASACERTPNAPIIDTMFIWTNRGDGSFFDAGGSSYFVDERLSPNPSASKARRNGLSLADWDGDGDMDLIGRGIFRFNRFVDGGGLLFQETNHPPDLPSGVDALAAFADWDLDGDLDTAIATWSQNGYFFENTTFDGADDVSARPYLRIRPLRDDDEVQAGLETEFGAIVEVRVVNSELPFRRRQFVSSAGGYLNQHEYSLTFGLNGPALPADPEVEIIVDFPSVAGEPRIRVDRLVNDHLGGLEPLSFASDEERRMDVFRNGDVRVGDTLYPATNVESRQRFMAGADADSGVALQSLSEDGALGPLMPTSFSIGIDFDTVGGDHDLWISELIIDGKLSHSPDVCDLGEGNIALWDVTDPLAPSLVPGGLIDAETPVGNHRTSLPVRIRILKDHKYRLVAKVTEYRATHVPSHSGNLVSGLRTLGGLMFANDDPCDGTDVLEAVPQSAEAYLSFRYGR